MVTKENELCQPEGAFAGIHNNAVLLQAREQQAQMLLVLLHIIACYQQVVYVCVDEGQSTQDFVNEALECLRCIS